MIEVNLTRCLNLNQFKLHIQGIVIIDACVLLVKIDITCSPNGEFCWKSVKELLGMEIHQLEYFLAVEKYRNFSTAAVEICVSQSTLSQQIHKLEDSLGVKLFIREPRSIKLSPAGEEFYTYARRIMSEVHRSIEAMQEYTNFNKGHISIGAIPTIAYLGFNRTIMKFIKAYPGISIEIHEANTDDLLKSLHEKKINIAFITSPYISDFPVDFYPLIYDEVSVLVPSTHRLANEPSIDFRDLADEKFLMIKSSSGYRNALTKACSEAGFDPSVILESSHVEVLRSYVEGEIGVALMGYRIAKSITNEHTSVVHIRKTVERENGLAVLQSNSLPLATKLFRDFALKHGLQTSRE